MANLPALFTEESSFEKHFTAQEKNCPKYMATLLVLQRIGTEILQSKQKAIQKKCPVSGTRLASKSVQ